MSVAINTNNKVQDSRPIIVEEFEILGNNSVPKVVRTRALLHAAKFGQAWLDVDSINVIGGTLVCHSRNPEFTDTGAVELHGAIWQSKTAKIAYNMWVVTLENKNGERQVVDVCESNNPDFKSKRLLVDDLE